MSKLMRILVFFDLPVKTKAQRRTATRFRNFLLKDGYHMVQYSVYARVCAGVDSVATHRDRLQNALPKSGAVRMMVVTERQFNAIEILVGSESVYDKPQNEEQLMTF